MLAAMPPAALIIRLVLMGSSLPCRLPSIRRLKPDGRDAKVSGFTEWQVMAELRRTSAEMAGARRIAFGDYRFDCGARQLWRGDEEIKLAPRASALLAALAERSMQVVTKAELIDRLWNGKAVGDDALTSCVQELRRALCDDPRNPRFVETRHRRGYRLLVPVAPAGNLAMESPAMDRALLPPLPDKASIAVLPFLNLSGDPEQEYFVDGITEDVITELSRYRNLFVIARNSSFVYKAKVVDVRQVARELGVRYVLEGSIRRAGPRVRVTGQLIDAQDGSHVWAERYDRHVEDVFAVQEELTQAIVAALVPQLDGAELSRHMRLRPGNLAAHELAVRALAEAREGHRKTDGPLCDAAIDTAGRALALDPLSSTAWAALCWALWQHLQYGRTADVERTRAEALTAGTRAIEADPLNHSAWAIRGVYLCNNGRFAAGLQDLERAHELNPNAALVLCSLGYFQALDGDAPRGMDKIRRAIRLSPRDIARAAMHKDLALACVVGRRYAEALTPALCATSEAPSMAPALATLALVQVGLGDIAQARQTVARLRQIAPSHLDMRLEQGWACQRADDARRLLTFIRVAAGLEVPAMAEALR
jgi:TolB-like protein/Flp pilus assembly protein TadD